MEYLICRYHEVGLKLKNRNFFENKLIENIKKALTKVYFETVRKISGRILVKLSLEGQKNQKEVSERIKKVFGIVNFSFALKTEQDLNKIKEESFHLLQDKNIKTFKIQTQRIQKNFPFSSQEVNKEVGAFIVEKLQKKVDLKKPDLTCFIEIVENSAFLFLEKIKGRGGLPVGSTGKIILLISGGIDSPVAGFRLMKRGAKIIFLHFHSYPLTDRSSIEKTKKLVEILNQYQFESKLYLIPFSEAQKEIFQKTKEKFRVILYRRLMFKIAEAIAEKERALALATGENLGQVASQTLENIGVIEEITKLPVLRPLIGQDKEEIIEEAKNIGTFEISIIPQEDCCSLFIPPHPATKAKLEEIKQEEKKLDLKKLIKLSLKKIEVLNFKTNY